MIQKKVCMLGSFAVGKTSLVSRFVKSIFSEKYLTTVGVKIDKKVLNLDGDDVQLMLWDLQGEDEFNRVRMSYFRGASGFLLVADGTRPETLDIALELKERVDDSVGDLPFIMLLNKADLEEDWEIGPEPTAALDGRGWTVMKTSAKTGQNVEQAFQALTGKMLAR